MRDNAPLIRRARPLLVPCAFALALLASGSPAGAAVPHAVKIQGFLTDRSGATPVPANGTHSMLFEIFDAETGGALEATVGPLSVEVTDGLYEAELPLMPEDFDGTPRFLQITVNGELLAPRLPMVSVPYAFRANRADAAAGVDPGAVGTPGLADGAVTEGKIGVVCPNPGDVLIWDGNVWSCGQAGPSTVCPAGSFVNCYSGPQGTLGVGICQAGQSFCKSDGSGFDACTGEILPAAESCDGLDNDCDGATDEDGVCGVCGNDITEPGEVCDGIDLGGASCSDFGFTGGTLACNGSCSGYDTSGCTGSCGDGVIGGTEQCDGANLGGETCTSLGFSGGTLSCDAGCSFDTSGCTGTCGDGLVSGSEECDGTNLGGETCTSLGFSGGTLSCDAACQHDTSGCTACSTEVCDGLDNDCDGSTDEGNPGGGVSCSTGLPGVCASGTTACSSGSLTCVQDQTASPEVCDGLDNDCDGSTDEGDPGGGVSCSTGLPGVCASGTTTCSGGSLTCQQDQTASPEVCDGLDNDCDGSTDEGNPGGGGSCSTGLPGVCASGTTTCSGGSLTCVQDKPAEPEICDGLDNDCDGSTDEGGACGVCGNDVIEAGETCDGADLGGATCADFGFTGGTLACDPSCSSYDTSGCSN